MVFLLKQVQQSSEALNVYYLPLINDKSKFVVVVERHCLKIYKLTFEEELELKAEIPVFETIISTAPFYYEKAKKLYLFIFLERKILKIISFKENLSTPYQAFTRNFSNDLLASAVQQSTLCINPTKFFCFYTLEGSLVFCPFYFDKTAPDRDLFRGVLEIHTLTRTHESQGRSPMLIECIKPHFYNKEDRELSIIYRDDVYDYYHTYVSMELSVKYLGSLKLPEQVSPIMVPILGDVITIFFGKTGLFMRCIPQIKNFYLNSGVIKNSSKNLIEMINVEMNEADYQIIKKNIPGNQELSITSSLHLTDYENDYILFSTRNGYLYLSKIQILANSDAFDEEIESLELLDWSLMKLRGANLFPPANMVLLSKDLILLQSRLGDRTIIKLDLTSNSFKIVNNYKGTPPVLDFNITDSYVPKFQVMGGDDLNSGLIRTMYNGYEITLKKSWKLKNDSWSFWRIGDIFIIKELINYSILKLKDEKLIESEDDFNGLKSVNGSIIDLNYNVDQLKVITETGVYRNGEIIKELDITTGTFSKDGDFIVASNQFLYDANFNKKQALSSEVSSISYLKLGKSSHILVGYWNGTADLIIDDIKTRIYTSEIPIKSVLIKRMGKKIACLIGNGNGELIFIKNIVKGNLVMEILKIGDLPIEVIDYQYDNAIVYNSESAILLNIDEQFNITESGYLKIDSPTSIKYDVSKEELIYLKDNRISIIASYELNQLLSKEIKLSRLVRKCTKFRNHMHLSVFVTIHEQYDESLNLNITYSQLEIMNNNTFKIVSTFKFNPGIEVTNIINTKYIKGIIDNYLEDENISISMKNIFNQVFVVSCVSQSLDDLIAPLMVFTIDEDGHIKYQCSTQEAKVEYYGLMMFFNGIVIGCGKAVGAYKLEYSISDDKFSLERISDYFKTQYYFSTINSIDSNIIAADVINGLKLLKLRGKEAIQSGDTSLKFIEIPVTFETPHFLTSLEVHKSRSLVITADSLNIIRVCSFKDKEFELILRFDLKEQINVIKSVNDNSSIDEHEIIPCFIIGTSSGSVYSLSICSSEDLRVEYEEIIHNDSISFSSIEHNSDYFASFKIAKTTQDYHRIYNNFIYGEIDNEEMQQTNLVNHLILGDLLEKYGNEDSKKIIKKHCNIL